ncbi:hypothetical protein [Flavobacterium sp. GCM10027622]|uniref:hypothetical protein n=1 Tax=unclassified Flavobacterium TaxID=196869 RepID=UPI00361EF995
MQQSGKLKFGLLDYWIVRLLDCSIIGLFDYWIVGFASCDEGITDNSEGLWLRVPQPPMILRQAQ